MGDVYDSVILVTGVTGYLGSHVAKQLLEAGRKVRGTVRSTKNEERLELLRKTLCENPKHQIEFVQANLTSEDGWNEALEGCSGVVHVASPFPNIAAEKVLEDDVVRPAKEGTLNVLKAASKTKSVKRIVLTSSFAAVSAEANYDESVEFDESMWADPDGPTIDIYSKSKVVAEKAAWDFLKELPDDQKFELAVINPTLVLGPPLLESHKAATSINLIADVMNKKFPMYPDVVMPVCDVRDVAKAHVLALTNPDAANNRHIMCSTVQHMGDWNNILANEFKPQGYSISTTQAPYAAMWILSLFSKPLKGTILPRWGKPLKIKADRMRNVLNIEPKDIETTLKDMAYAMIDLGILRKTKKYVGQGGPNNDSSIEKKVDDLKIEDIEPEDKPE